MHYGLTVSATLVQELQVFSKWGRQTQLVRDAHGEAC